MTPKDDLFITRIISFTCASTGVNIDELSIGSNGRQVVNRCIIAYFLRKKYSLKLKIVAEKIGRSHSDVISLLKAIDGYGKLMKRKVDALWTAIKSNQIDDIPIINYQDYQSNIPGGWIEHRVKNYDRDQFMKDPMVNRVIKKILSDTGADKSLLKIRRPPRHETVARQFIMYCIYEASEHYSYTDIGIYLFDDIKYLISHETHKRITYNKRYPGVTEYLNSVIEYGKTGLDNHTPLPEGILLINPFQRLPKETEQPKVIYRHKRPYKGKFDHENSFWKNEFAVKFRMDGKVFEYVYF